MAKAADLDIDLTAAMHQPPAATAPRSIKEKGREAPPPEVRHLRQFPVAR